MANLKSMLSRITNASWFFALSGLGLIAILYRVLSWNKLPPGISTSEANNGVLIQSIVAGSNNIGFHAETGFSPLWELLQSLNLYIFGSSSNSMRIIAVIIGLATVATTYGWVRSWYDRRTAWVAAFLMAVLPWSVTLSRNALSTILAPLMITAVLWALAGVMRNPESKPRLAGLISVSIIALLAGPWGWLALLFAGVALGFQKKLIRKYIRSKSISKLKLSLVTAVIISLAGLIAMIVVPSFSAIVQTFDFSTVSQWFVSAIRVSTMFFYHGDADFLHNLGGEPMLNAFMGLAFIAGLLVCFSRFQRSRDRMVLILVLLGLVPAIVSSGLVPSASRSSLALPAVALLCSIGTFYLLDLWSATFPINSAARSLGQTAIGILLALTAFQGYTQYFTAWANSSETHAVYNRSATAATGYTKALIPGIETHFVSDKSEVTVATFLLNKQASAIILPDQLERLEKGNARRFVVTAAARNAVLPILEKRFPGGTLKPHLDRDGTELYYDYVISK